VVAAAALDDVYAISAFGIALVLGAGDGSGEDAAVRFGLGLAELVGGLLLGVLVGTVYALPPSLPLCVCLGLGLSLRVLCSR